jgi:hypothetical protein
MLYCYSILAQLVFTPSNGAISNKPIFMTALGLQHLVYHELSREGHADWPGREGAHEQGFRKLGRPESCTEPGGALVRDRFTRSLTSPHPASTKVSRQVKLKFT